MKVLLVVDHFGPGGAQRQIVELACGMKRRGHQVEMFVYFPEHDFFRPLLEKHQIIVHEYAKQSRFSIGVLIKLIKLLRGGRFDVLISFLNSANIYAELAVLFAPNTKLVVSERTNYHDDRSPVRAFLRRALHGIADKVVANSRAQSEWLKRKWWLRNKTTYIYNGLDLRTFCPKKDAADPVGAPHLIGIGRIGEEKNILALITALRMLQEECGDAPHVSWAGANDDSHRGRSYRRLIDDALESLPEIRRRWRWLGVEADVASVLPRYHALIHPSLYEGLPNAVCEALASGVPVLASEVCDHPLLVAEGKRGFLFDPKSPKSIANAIKKFVNLSAAARRTFSLNAREYAEANLGVEKMTTEYEHLFTQLVQDTDRR